MTKEDELKSDCIEFNGVKNKDGYGVISISNNVFSAHRLSFKLYNPTIVLTKNKLICHHCDNPSCINPKHLFLGTYSTNNKDRTLKGRSAKGETHGRAKLSNFQIIQIREFIKLGVPNREIARSFNINQKVIILISKGKIWKSV